jgi:hypothetical protein
MMALPLPRNHPAAPQYCLPCCCLLLLAGWAPYGTESVPWASSVYGQPAQRALNRFAHALALAAARRAPERRP